MNCIPDERLFPKEMMNVRTPAQPVARGALYQLRTGHQYFDTRDAAIDYLERSITAYEKQVKKLEAEIYKLNGSGGGQPNELWTNMWENCQGQPRKRG